MPPHKYQICKVRSADATGAGKFPAGLFGQVGFALAFLVSRPPGAGEQGRLSHHCTTEFIDATYGQGACILHRESSSGAKGSGACRDPSAAQPDHAHTGLGIIHSRAHPVALPRVIKVSRAASHQLPSARGLCPNEGRGEASWTRRVRSPLGSAADPAPNTQPRKTGLWWPSQTNSLLWQESIKKNRGKDPLLRVLPNVTGSYPRSKN